MSTGDTVGVPRIEPDLSLDVETWWAQHPYRLWQETAPYRQEEIAFIQSPSPVVDVQSFGATPTAGIQEALNALPPTGGTLFFRPGIYSMTGPLQVLYNRYLISGIVAVLRRSNIHFVGSDQGPVIITAANRMLCFSSQEFADTCRDPNGTPPNNVIPGCGQQPGLETRPERNFYFKNLIFDGQGQALTFIRFEGVRDILFSGCTFRNGLFNQVGQSHPGFIESISGNNNVFCKDCIFIGDGRSAIYWDGGRGNGLVNCQFFGNWSLGPAVLLTNDDIQRRNTRMFAFVNNYFDCTAGEQFVTLAGSQLLFADNTGSLNSRTDLVANWDGKNSIFPAVVYDSSNLVIRDNILQTRVDVAFLKISTATVNGRYRIGRYRLLNNQHKAALLVQEVLRDNGVIEGPNQIQNNVRL